VGDELTGRQRAEVSGLSSGDGVKEPQLLGQDFRRIVVLVVQRAVECVELFVKFF
jgi:hypothetical protein